MNANGTFNEPTNSGSSILEPKAEPQPSYLTWDDVGTKKNGRRIIAVGAPKGDLSGGAAWQPVLCWWDCEYVVWDYYPLTDSFGHGDYFNPRYQPASGIQALGKAVTALAKRSGF